MSGRGRGKKGSKTDAIDTATSEEDVSTSKKGALNKKAKAPVKKVPKETKTTDKGETKNLKKRPNGDGGITKKRPLKKKQSDRLLKAIVDGEDLDSLRELVKSLKNEESEALAKKEAKTKA